MAPALAALCGLNEQALDLCRALGRIERPQRDAAERTATGAGEQQPPARRCVVTGKTGKLGVESLETQIDIEPLCIFQE